MPKGIIAKIGLGVVICLVVMAFLVFILQSFMSTAVLSYLLIARPFKVTGASMNPALKNGMFILTRVVNPATTFNRGDIIIYRSSAKPEMEYLKRIVGLPGETVTIQNGDVLINGTPLDERPYVSGAKTYGSQFIQESQPQTIPADNYFVLGDNRAHSTDSRSTGFVNISDIIAKYWLCYWNCN